MLTKNQLKQLRKEIVLNSLFLNDYNNSLFIKEKTACAFFDSYIEYLYEIAHENNFKSNDITDVLNKYDNIENLYNYYLCYENDPLLQDDYIATKHINNSDGIVIYNIESQHINNYALVAIHYLSGLYIFNTKIKKYKLYYACKRGYYFNYNKIRYYIDDFIKVNYIDRLLKD